MHLNTQIDKYSTLFNNYKAYVVVYLWGIKYIFCINSPDQKQIIELIGCPLNMFSQYTEAETSHEYT